MKKYFINHTIDEEQIIDFNTLEQAEKGNNYFNPDDFMFLCEAESLEEAQQKYRLDTMLSRLEARYHL